MSARPPLTVRANAYLKARRALGVALRIEGQQLLSFGRFVDREERRGPLTEALALTWARAAPRATRVGQARRLEVIRPFARWLQAYESDTEVPAVGLLGPSHHRRTPYLFSDAEIDELLTAAAQLSPVNGLRPLTFRTLFGLVACTGLRPGEPGRLTRGDVDLQAGLLVVRETKGRKSRLVPLHPTAKRALTIYARERDRHIPHPDNAAFFLLDAGLPVTTRKAQIAFDRVRRRLGWTASPGRRAPRLYDLRHRFACERLLRWHADRADVNTGLPALSTYLGHVKVSDTYWYLSAAPALMAVCARRFEQFTGPQSERRQ